MHDEIVMAFDFGVRRIGVAIGATMLKSARPLTTIAAAANAARFEAIGRLIVQWQPARLVVGLPLAPDVAEHEMTARSRRFANQLRGRFGLPVEFADERWSSTAAEQSLRAQGHDLRRDKPAIDAAAAAVILQSYFDRTHHADPALSA
ncbi:MAG: Holliday junction DNA helicase RuvA [Rhodocyclales bacterium GWA2_65_20]|nr:MAG: Holliday junction DNA helicase RuvA [Rhodocyclales bacterium GWA2_65_20]